MKVHGSKKHTNWVNFLVKNGLYGNGLWNLIDFPITLLPSIQIG